jgi:hypothetical protein
MAKLWIQDIISKHKSCYVLLDAEPQPSGYIESDLIVDWNYYGRRCVGVIALPTMLALRTIIGDRVDAIGFDNLNNEEKIIASQWVVITKAQRDTVRTPTEQFEDRKNLLYNISTDYNELCIFDDNVNLVQIKVNTSGTLYVDQISTF